MVDANVSVWAWHLVAQLLTIYTVACSLRRVVETVYLTRYLWIFFYVEW